MELTLLKEGKRIPIASLIGGIMSMLMGISTVACGEKPGATQAPAEVVAPAPEPAPVLKPAVAQAPAPTDPAAALPAEVRTLIPADAVLKEVITGEGAIASATDGAESHQRHAYDLPDGAAGIVAVVTWKDTAWKEIEIAVGIGLCPHRGRKLESARGSSGVAALHHGVQADEALAEDKWFLHVNADAGLAANPGKSLLYSYAVYSY
jgi:hypothetical protein